MGVLRMVDGPVANLPAGMNAYAGYVDAGGIGITWPAVQLIPADNHLSVSVHGAAAMCGDVESGALGSWIGYDYGYAQASKVGALIVRDGRPQKLWVAHYTDAAHICTSDQCWPQSPVPWVADGTQWTTHNNTYDESLLADDFFILDPPGGPMALTQADMTGIQLMMRQEFAGSGNELFDRVVQACMQALREQAPLPPSPPPVS